MVQEQDFPHNCSIVEMHYIDGFFASATCVPKEDEGPLTVEP